MAAPGKLTRHLSGYLALSANSLRHADLPTRLTAARAAGFDAVGLRLSDYQAARDAGRTDAGIRAMLTDAGLGVLEIEHTWDWAAPGDATTTAVLAAAAAVAARQVNLVLFARHPWADVVDGYRRVADRAAGLGLRVGLEFLPYSAVPTPGAAWDVVAGADRPNTGVIVDAWHFFRSGSRVDQLAAIPAERITSVQLNDVRPDTGPTAPTVAELREEARHHRLPPGAGDGDLAGLLNALAAVRATAPVSVEVFSDWLDGRPAMEAAHRLMAATRRTLAAAGWPSRRDLREGERGDLDPPGQVQTVQR